MRYYEYNDEYEYEWQKRERLKDQEKWEAHCELSNSIKRLGENLERVGMVATFGQARYAKGFSDGTLLREFCEDYTPEAYFPMADSRPTAERLQWLNTTRLKLNDESGSTVAGETLTNGKM